MAKQVAPLALQCSTCKLPLSLSKTEAQLAGSKVLCPRCNNWTELENSCTGGCLTCKSNSSLSESSCASLANSKEYSEISIEIGVRNKRGPFQPFFDRLAKVLGGVLRRS